MKFKPYFAHGRNQIRLGFTWIKDGIPRYRWIGVTWQ